MALPSLALMDASGASSAFASGALQRLCCMVQPNGISLNREVAVQVGWVLPHSNLLHTIGHAKGFEEETFKGASTGVVDGLLV